MPFDSDPSIPCKRIKCPKCGKEPFALDEVWENHNIQFAYADGKRGREGWLGEGSPVAVVARCECGYAWRLRGITQITELDLKSE